MRKQQWAPLKAIEEMREKEKKNKDEYMMATLANIVEKQKAHAAREKKDKEEREREIIVENEKAREETKRRSARGT